MSPVCRAGRRRALVATLSVLGHGILIVGLVSGQPADTPAPVDPPAMAVVLAPPWIERPPDPPPPAAAKPAARVAASAPRRLQVHAPRHPTVTPTLLADGVGRLTGPGEAEMLGAATAGTGQGEGAGCNMLRRLQDALRKDHRVQAAVSDVEQGGALMVWNGNWVRHPGQDGAGLAAVREAILWEVGFAPPDCRLEVVTGMVVVSLGDSPDSARLALGSGSWRWRDLLFAGGGAARR